MLTTVVRLCCINRHKTVWFSLVLAVKASLQECFVMTSGKIYLLQNESQQFYQIQNLILKMDIHAFLDSVVNDRIEKSTNVHYENMQNYKGQKENF
jgi:hypothetical protein